MLKIRIQKGFTLIELLVVIAIISLLSSIVLASVNAARNKAKDARRRIDLKQLQLALELYLDDNGSYPSTSGTWYGVNSLYNSTFVQQSGPNGWIPNLAPAHIPILPVDPTNAGPDTGYLYRSNGTDHKLIAFQTVASCPVLSTDPMYDPARNPTTAWASLVPCTYAIYTPAAAGW